MSKHGTKIQWTHFPGYKGETWNPVTGCSHISPGCDHCYAERISKRFGWPWGKPMFHADRIYQPTRWKKPRVIFVCSMSDLFHEKISFNTVRAIFQEMANNPRHLFLVLTKRPEGMKAFVEYIYQARVTLREGSTGNIPDNIWLGVTAENQQTADERIPILLQTPCAHRFVSVEPMLEAVDLEVQNWLYPCDECGSRQINNNCESCDGMAALDWVICGGESGPGAREIEIEWVTRLMDDCTMASVPFFMKQWSDYGTGSRHNIPEYVIRNEFPEVSDVSIR